MKGYQTEEEFLRDWNALRQLNETVILSDYFSTATLIKYKKVYEDDVQVCKALVALWTSQTGKDYDEKYAEFLNKRNVRLDANEGLCLPPEIIRELSFFCYDVNRKPKKANSKDIDWKIVNRKFYYQPNSAIVLAFYLNKGENIARLGCFDAGHRVRGFHNYFSSKRLDRNGDQCLFAILLNTAGTGIKYNDFGLRKTSPDIIDMLGFKHIKPGFFNGITNKKVKKPMMEALSHIASEEGLGRLTGKIIDTGKKNDIDKIQDCPFPYAEKARRMALIIQDAFVGISKKELKQGVCNKSTSLAHYCLLEQFWGVLTPGFQDFLNDVIKCTALIHLREYIVWASKIAEAHKDKIFSTIETCLTTSGTGGERQHMTLALLERLSDEVINPIWERK
jgi:hypothetical protein